MAYCERVAVAEEIPLPTNTSNGACEAIMELLRRVDDRRNGALSGCSTLAARRLLSCAITLACAINNCVQRSRRSASGATHRRLQRVRPEGDKKRGMNMFNSPWKASAESTLLKEYLFAAKRDGVLAMGAVLVNGGLTAVDRLRATQVLSVEQRRTADEAHAALHALDSEIVAGGERQYTRAEEANANNGSLLHVGPPHISPVQSLFESVRLLQFVVNEVGGSSLCLLAPLRDITVCALATWQLLGESTLLEVAPPFHICGDTHVQHDDLLRLFGLGGGAPPAVRYLFLGDYVDRGRRGLDTIVLLTALKLRHPTCVYLLRGNHECARLNRLYGFYEECRRLFSIALWKRFQALFDALPLSALVGGRIFCTHGGLSPHLTDWASIRAIARPLHDRSDVGLPVDLLWADPEREDGARVFRPNEVRGVSFTFGADVVAAFCERLGVELFVRAHKVVQEGFDLLAGDRLVTIFSAAAYCGEFDNAAALLHVDSALHCTFRRLRPVMRRAAPPHQRRRARSHARSPQPL